MKVLVAGSGGQLGIELTKLMPEKGHEVVALGHKDLDISDAESVKRALESYEPDLILNSAAYTDVDGCETETEAAYRINSLGPRNLAQFGERLGCGILHVSTNYVFDGASECPYGPDDLPNPISAYGRTKLAGEEYVKSLSNRWYVVRSAGVYGQGHNFVRTMLRVGAERDSLKVKADEYISPTYAKDLALGIAEIVDGGLYGTYHVANAGSCSWYEFAQEIFALSGTEVELSPVASSEYPLPAPRPANGVLSTLGGPELRHWREALDEYLSQNREVSAGL